LIAIVLGKEIRRWS